MNGHLFNILLIAYTVTIIALSGCSRSELGIPIPPDAPKVKLADITASPTEYSGRKVVMHGIVSAQCPSLCEFTYKEGTQTILIFPQGFKFPKLNVGRPVTVYAEITSGPGQVVVTALGIKLK